MGKIAGVASILLLSRICLAASGNTWYVDGSVRYSGNGSSWEKAFKAIQEGIDAASHGDTVILAEGTYVENIHFDGKNITLRSTDPLDPDVVDRSIIDGNQAGSVVTFDGTENETCLLSGFTLQHGNALSGGGICGGTPLDHTRATIENNDVAVSDAAYGGGMAHCDGAIRNNLLIADSALADGGGMYDCDGLIEDNSLRWNSAECGGGLYGCDGIVRQNGLLYNSARDGGGFAHCQGLILRNGVSWGSADFSGGGLYRCGGTIDGNSIDWNVALDGGAVSHCDGPILRNEFSGNSAARGGALYACNGPIRHNLIGCAASYPGGGSQYEQIYGNKADQGGGLYLCEGLIEGNVIVGNSVTGSQAYGGGLYICPGTIRSNIIAGNSANYGGGIAGCGGAILNNTIVHNSAAWSGGGLYLCNGTIHNCILWENTASTGEQFAECSSPAYCCVQDGPDGVDGNIARNPAFVDYDGPDDDPATHYDNDYRLSATSPCIDAGNNSVLTPPGFDADGNLRIASGNDSPAADMGAYEYNSVPFLLTKISEGTHGIVITWNSQPNDTYILWSCSDSLMRYWTKKATMSSEGAAGSWTDTTLLGRMRFYRIEMK